MTPMGELVARRARGPFAPRGVSATHNAQRKTLKSFVFFLALFLLLLGGSLLVQVSCPKYHAICHHYQAPRHIEKRDTQGIRALCSVCLLLRIQPTLTYTACFDVPPQG